MLLRFTSDPAFLHNRVVVAVDDDGGCRYCLLGPGRGVSSAKVVYGPRKQFQQILQWGGKKLQTASWLDIALVISARKKRSREPLQPELREPPRDVPLVSSLLRGERCGTP